MTAWFDWLILLKNTAFADTASETWFLHNTPERVHFLRLNIVKAAVSHSQMGIGSKDRQLPLKTKTEVSKSTSWVFYLLHQHPPVLGLKDLFHCPLLRLVTRTLAPSVWKHNFFQLLDNEPAISIALFPCSTEEKLLTLEICYIFGLTKELNLFMWWKVSIYKPVRS